MRIIFTTVLALAALIGAGSGRANADLYFVSNKADKSVWVTNYNAVGRIANADCLTPGAVKQYSDGKSTYALAAIVYTRGELKQNSNCGGKTLADTGRGSPISIGQHTGKVFVMVGSNFRVQ